MIKMEAELSRVSFFSLSFIDEGAEKLAWLLDPLLPVMGLEVLNILDIF